MNKIDDYGNYIPQRNTEKSLNKELQDYEDEYEIIMYLISTTKVMDKNYDKLLSKRDNIILRIDNQKRKIQNHSKGLNVYGDIKEISLPKDYID